MKNSDLSENLVTRGSISDIFLTWHLGQRSHMRSIFAKHVEIQNCKRKNRKACFPKMSEIKFPGLGKQAFRFFLLQFWISTCFAKMDLIWLLWPKCQVKKISDIDPLVTRFSLKSEFFIGNFHQRFSFGVNPIF
jgi:hypothetical protein